MPAIIFIFVNFIIISVSLNKNEVTIMQKFSKNILSSEDRERFISILVPELATLRTKADISQQELAVLLGVTRQTYNAIECKSRKMSWNTYLALIFFYDHNQKTHQLLRTMNIFPYDLISLFNNGEDTLEMELSDFMDKDSRKIIDCLDEQAVRTIKIMIMAEYARCANLSTEAAVKSFNGLNFMNSERTEKENKALGEIKGKQTSGEE